MAAYGSHILPIAKKVPQNSPTNYKTVSTSNTLLVQPLTNLGQSLPNLNLNSTHITNNTLLVPGIGTSALHSNLLSPSHRGVSYPPPSPTRATLRRGFAFSSSIKNPPLIKSRNVQSQNSFNANALASSHPSPISSGSQQATQPPHHLTQTQHHSQQQYQQQQPQQQSITPSCEQIDKQNLQRSNESDV